MNVTEYLMSQLGEEAAEISQIASKSNRFGLRDVYPKDRTGTDNVEKLIGELNDLAGTVEELQARGILPKVIWSREKMSKKREKIRHYMDYARRVGTLKD